MAIFSGIAAALKLLGIGGGFIRDLRKDSLDYKLAAKNSDNEAERIELEHKAKVVDMQLADIQDARSKARTLPRSLVLCMATASAVAVLWLAAGVFRSLYGYAAVNELDGQIWDVVKIIFQFLFGGGAAMAVANRLKS